jgi:hypothetical protein
MKKIFISLLALSSVLLLMLSSCKKDENKVYASIGDAGTLSASTTSPALSLATAANTAVTFSFPATAVNGNQSAVTYTLQIDKNGNNFARPTEIAATAGTTSVSVDALNTALHNLGLKDSVQTQVEVRTKSAIAANVAASYSNVLTLTVTPYSKKTYLYVPGGYQGWNPATAPKLESPTDNKLYDGTVTVKAETTDFGFKINVAPDWNHDNYGGANGILDASGANINFPGPGTYKIHVDMGTMSYTITKQ